MKRLLHLLIRRGWLVCRTRILWGWRLYSLGRRSVLEHHLLVNNPRAVAIGSRVTIAKDFVLSDQNPGHGECPKIVVGDGCTIMYRFQCNAAQSVRIGRNVLVASNVLITDSDHVVEAGDVPATRNARLVTQPVSVGDNCWLGQNVVILRGVTVGHDSVVGANSVVTHDIPPCSVVVGNPAHVIRTTRK